MPEDIGSYAAGVQHDHAEEHGEVEDVSSVRGPRAKEGLAVELRVPIHLGGRATQPRLVHKEEVLQQNQDSGEEDRDAVAL